MSFIHPDRLWLLIVLPIILVVTMMMLRRRSEEWLTLVAPRLRERLIRKESPPLRWISFGLALLGCAFLILVIARPYKGVTTTLDQISSRNIILAIDTSRSMLVQDGAPDRITAAKAISIELLEAFPNDRVGVIAFSGVPLLMAPLTIDHAAVQEIIGQLDTEIVPSGGSDLAASALLAIETFKKTEQKSNALIIISDGEDHSVETGLAANEIEQAGIRVCAIGVGTAEGGVIPDPSMRDGRFRDHQGRVVRSKLNPSALQQISNTGGGRYVSATSGADHLMRAALSTLESEDQEGDLASVPNERYHWFLIPAVICLIISLILSGLLKRVSQRNLSVIGLMTITLTLATQPIQASVTLEKAEEAYAKKDYETAISAFTESLAEFKPAQRRGIEYSIATSAYRLQKYEEAIRYFSKSLLTTDLALQEQSHFSLANSLFHSGWITLNPPQESPQTPAPQQGASHQQPAQPDKAQVISLWEDAITHYEAVLMSNPKNNDAQHNLEEVKKLLEELKKQQEEQQEEQEQQQQEQDNQENQEDEEQDSEEQDGESGEEDEQEGEESEQEGEEESEEGEQESDSKNSDQQDSQSENSDQNQQAEQEEGESDEEFAARILEEQSDLETRPVSQRRRFQRRQAKDW